MADMSLSERYDYLKVASIYNNVRERGIERDGAGLKIKGASGKAKETVCLGGRGKGTVASAQKGLVCWSKTLHPMGREQPSAMALLSQFLRPQHSLPVTPAFGADKVPPPGCGLSPTPGTR